MALHCLSLQGMKSGKQMPPRLLLPFQRIEGQKHPLDPLPDLALRTVQVFRLSGLLPRPGKLLLKLVDA